MFKTHVGFNGQQWEYGQPSGTGGTRSSNDRPTHIVSLNQSQCVRIHSHLHHAIGPQQATHYPLVMTNIAMENHHV